MGKPISVIGKRSNLDKWANYAKRNSYDGNECKRQARRDLDASTANKDSSIPDMAAPDQKDKEGQGWAEFTSCCQRESAYTGKGGSKRD